MPRKQNGTEALDVAADLRINDLLGGLKPFTIISSGDGEGP